MSPEVFDNLVERRIEDIKLKLLIKKTEYAPGVDRLQNFKDICLFGKDGETPEQAAWYLARKQLVGLLGWVLLPSQEPSQEQLDEKFGDFMAYLLLIEGLLVERRFEGVKNLLN